MGITGKDIIELGYPPGPVVGKALAVAKDLEDHGAGEDAIIERLAAFWQDPDSHVGVREAGDELAKEISRLRAPEPSYELEDKPYEVWGEEMIDPNTLEQMDNAMRLPITVGGALMPDAHLGYGLPVGGVLATKDAVVPWAVGVDIACRMRLSVFPLFEDYLEREKEGLKEILVRNTVFGPGGRFKPGRRLVYYMSDGTRTEGSRREHPVLDDPAWEATPFLKELKDTAYQQLGTSGSGNHFVEWGIYHPWTFRYSEYGRPSILAPLPSNANFLAILSHSGSRGVGYKIATRYSKIAKRKHPRLPRELQDLAWLDLSEEEGEEYWLSMELAGKFASANHAVIHERMSRAIGFPPDLLGSSSIMVVENHHNYCWKEEWNGEEVLVHRKGATPAAKEELGVIPGSMGDAGYVVSGRGSEDAINSASHGAGRLMSRTQAKKNLDREEWRQDLVDSGIELVGGDLDEAPQAYKSIAEVIALQEGELVDVVGTFTPRIVRMDTGKNRKR